MIQHIISQYGVFAVGFLILLECMGVPLPGETVLLLAGAAAAQGFFPIWAVVISAATAAIVGDSVGYWLGRRYGEAIIDWLTRWLHIPPSHIQQAQALFQRHGANAVFFGRFVWVLRTFGALFAGISAIPYRRFLAYNVAGGLTWALTISLLGYFFGSYLPQIERWLRQLGWASVAVVAVIVVCIVIGRKLIRARTHQPALEVLEHGHGDEQRHKANQRHTDADLEEVDEGIPTQPHHQHIGGCVAAEQKTSLVENV